MLGAPIDAVKSPMPPFVQPPTVKGRASVRRRTALYGMPIVIMGTGSCDRAVYRMAFATMVSEQ